MSQKTEVVITARDETRAAIASAQRGLQGLSASAQRIGSTFASIGVGGGLLGLIGGVGAISTIKSAIDELDALNLSAQRLGISAGKLETLNFAGKLAGLDGDDIEKTLTKISVKLEEAAAGSKDAIAWFDKLGVSWKDAAGNVKTADKAFEDVSDKIGGMADGTGKVAILVDGFGEKLGRKLAPALNDSAKGLKAMREEVDQLGGGGVNIDELARQADAFNDNLDKMAFASNAAARSLVGDLLPGLVQFSNEILVAIKNSDDFYDVVVSRAKTLNFKDAKDSLADLNKEAAKLEDRLSIGRGQKGDADRLQQLQKEIGFYAKLEAAREKPLEPPKANLPRGGLPPEPPKKTGGTKAQSDEAARLLASLREQVALNEVDLQGTEKMTGAEKEAAKVKYQLESGTLKATDAQRASIFAALESLSVLEKSLVAQEEYRKALESQEATNVKNNQAMLEQIAAAEKAADLYGLNAAQISVVEQARLADAIAIAAENGATEEQIAFMKEELAMRAKLSDALIQGETKVLDKKDAEDALAAVSELDEFTKSAAKNMQSAFADFLFDPFADGIDQMGYKFAQTIQRMAAEALAANIMKSLFGDYATGGKTGDNGWVGLAMTAAKAYAGSFANGGIMTSDGPVPLRKYATGGVASSPQMALFGEGSTPEAYVPLPDGRRIPVAMSGGGASQPQNIRIVNAFDNSVIGDYLGSAAGEKVIMNAVQRNAGAFRQAMA